MLWVDKWVFEEDRTESFITMKDVLTSNFSISSTIKIITFNIKLLKLFKNNKVDFDKVWIIVYGWNT